jgi:4-amino-4-deoxy-L-arabinose transferase-like glycosyltransferase
MLARGDLLEPTIFGLRWAEKPALLSWLIAGAARLTGAVDEWSARLFPMLAILATALLVERFTRRYAGRAAALFAAAAFMFCPMLLRKIRVAEPDTIITLLSFAALVVWWTGEERGRVSLGRWLACGALLATLAMAKGPQPVGFFALGVGAYVVARRRWATLPGLALCLALPAAATLAWAAAVYRGEHDLSVWFTYLRVHDLRFNVRHYVRERLRFAIGLPIDLLPGALLVPAALGAWRRAPRAAGAPGPILPLAAYAGLCTLTLLVWPGTKTRYAMPIAPAVAVLAGLAFGPLIQRRRRIAVAALAGAVGLFVYQVVFVTVVIPHNALKYGAPRRRAPVLDAAIAASPAPVFTIGKAQSNKLFYLMHPIVSVGVDSRALEPPAWVFASRRQLQQLRTLRPDLGVREVMPAINSGGLVLARIEAPSS